MKEIFIFDIDGCIMPPMFPNVYENSNGTREEVIKEAFEKAKNISIFPEFLKYYQKFCKDAQSVLFITGRQKSEFKELTEKQLSDLKEISSFKLIYYPEEKSHSPKEYFTWKFDKIKEILCQNIDFQFKIFDDMADYFPELKIFARKQKLNVELIPILNSNTWSSILV